MPLWTAKCSGKGRILRQGSASLLLLRMRAIMATLLALRPLDGFCRRLGHSRQDRLVCGRCSVVIGSLGQILYVIATEDNARCFAKGYRVLRIKPHDLAMFSTAVYMASGHHLHLKKYLSEGGR